MIRDYYTHEDGKLSIITDSGIFEYPALHYIDFDDTIIPVKTQANWGDLYNLVNQYVLYNLRIDYHGEGSGTFKVRLYINDEETPFTELTFPIPHSGIMERRLQPRGRIRSLRLEIDDVTTNDEFKISRISLGVAQRPNIGNR